MTHGSLFSGIGGFDLAAEYIGFDNLFHCEWNIFCQKVLKYYWPNAQSFNDIKKTNFTKYANKIDILTGGFPCQPYSTAGKRKGKEDERHLWPEMLRAITEIQPRWIVGENVRGIINWSRGLVFNEVQIDLEIKGYEVLPFLLPACAVNAPHRRDRVWFIAYNNGFGRRKNNRQRKSKQFEKNVKNGIVADSNSFKYAKQQKNDKEKQNIKFEKFFRTQNCWETFPTEYPVCYGNDGISEKLDGITFPKWRNESIKAAGNAIVPQVAYNIFNSILKFENLNK